MSTVTILFGTETGNAEMVAEDMAAWLSDEHIDAEVMNMEDVEPGQLQRAALVVLVASTYGEGELPGTAVPFHSALEEDRPDLSSLRFAAFGLGDSGYETYNQGIKTLIGAFVALGAQQVGATGFHDIATGSDPSELATAWAAEVVVAELVHAVER